MPMGTLRPLFKSCNPDRPVQTPNRARPEIEKNGQEMDFWPHQEKRGKNGRKMGKWPFLTHFWPIFSEFGHFSPFSPMGPNPGHQMSLKTSPGKKNRPGEPEPLKTDPLNSWTTNPLKLWHRTPSKPPSPTPSKRTTSTPSKTPF